MLTTLRVSVLSHSLQQILLVHQVALARTKTRTTKTSLSGEDAVVVLAPDDDLSAVEDGGRSNSPRDEESQNYHEDPRRGRAGPTTTAATSTAPPSLVEVVGEQAEDNEARTAASSAASTSSEAHTEDDLVENDDHDRVYLHSGRQDEIDSLEDELSSSTPEAAPADAHLQLLVQLERTKQHAVVPTSPPHQEKDINPGEHQDQDGSTRTAGVAVATGGHDPSTLPPARTLRSRTIKRRNKRKFLGRDEEEEVYVPSTPRPEEQEAFEQLEVLEGGDGAAAGGAPAPRKPETSALSLTAREAGTTGNKQRRTEREVDGDRDPNRGTKNQQDRGTIRFRPTAPRLLEVDDHPDPALQRSTDEELLPAGGALLHVKEHHHQTDDAVGAARRSMISVSADGELAAEGKNAVEINAGVNDEDPDAATVIPPPPPPPAVDRVLAPAPGQLDGDFLELQQQQQHEQRSSSRRGREDQEVDPPQRSSQAEVEQVVDAGDRQADKVQVVMRHDPSEEDHDHLGAGGRGVEDAQHNFSPSPFSWLATTAQQYYLGGTAFLDMISPASDTFHLQNGDVEKEASTSSSNEENKNIIGRATTVKSTRQEKTLPSRSRNTRSYPTKFLQRTDEAAEVAGGGGASNSYSWSHLQQAAPSSHAEGTPEQEEEQMQIELPPSTTLGTTTSTYADYDFLMPTSATPPSPPAASSITRPAALVEVGGGSPRSGSRSPPGGSRKSSGDSSAGRTGRASVEDVVDDALENIVADVLENKSSIISTEEEARSSGLLQRTAQATETGTKINEYNAHGQQSIDPPSVANIHILDGAAAKAKLASLDGSITFDPDEKKKMATSTSSPEVGLSGITRFAKSVDDTARNALKTVSATVKRHNPLQYFHRKAKTHDSDRNGSTPKNVENPPEQEWAATEDVGKHDGYTSERKKDADGKALVVHAGPKLYWTKERDKKTNSYWSEPPEKVGSQEWIDFFTPDVDDPDAEHKLKCQQNPESKECQPKQKAFTSGVMELGKAFFNLVHILTIGVAQNIYANIKWVYKTYLEPAQIEILQDGHEEQAEDKADDLREGTSTTTRGAAENKHQVFPLQLPVPTPDLAQWFQFFPMSLRVQRIQLPHGDHVQPCRHEHEAAQKKRDLHDDIEILRGRDSGGPVCSMDSVSDLLGLSGFRKAKSLFFHIFKLLQENVREGAALHKGERWDVVDKEVSPWLNSHLVGEKTELYHTNYQMFLEVGDPTRDDADPLPGRLVMELDVQSHLVGRLLLYAFEEFGDLGSGQFTLQLLDAPSAGVESGGAGGATATGTGTTAQEVVGGEEGAASSPASSTTPAGGNTDTTTKQKKYFAVSFRAHAMCPCLLVNHGKTVPQQAAATTAAMLEKQREGSDRGSWLPLLFGKKKKVFLNRPSDHDLGPYLQPVFMGGRRRLDSTNSFPWALYGSLRTPQEKEARLREHMQEHATPRLEHQLRLDDLLVAHTEAVVLASVYERKPLDKERENMNKYGETGCSLNMEKEVWYENFSAQRLDRQDSAQVKKLQLAELLLVDVSRVLRDVIVQVVYNYGSPPTSADDDVVAVDLGVEALLSEYDERVEALLSHFQSPKPTTTSSAQEGNMNQAQATPTPQQQEGQEAGSGTDQAQATPQQQGRQELQLETIADTLRGLDQDWRAWCRKNGGVLLALTKEGYVEVQALGEKDEEQRQVWFPFSATKTTSRGETQDVRILTPGVPSSPPSGSSSPAPASDHFSDRFPWCYRSPSLEAVQKEYTMHIPESMFVEAAEQKQSRGVEEPTEKDSAAPNQSDVKIGLLSVEPRHLGDESGRAFSSTTATSSRVRKSKLQGGRTASQKYTRQRNRHFSRCQLRRTSLTGVFPAIEAEKLNGQLTKYFQQSFHAVREEERTRAQEACDLFASEKEKEREKQAAENKKLEEEKQAAEKQAAENKKRGPVGAWFNKKLEEAKEPGPVGAWFNKNKKDIGKMVGAGAAVKLGAVGLVVAPHVALPALAVAKAASAVAGTSYAAHAVLKDKERLAAEKTGPELLRDVLKIPQKVDVGPVLRVLPTLHYPATKDDYENRAEGAGRVQKGLGLAAGTVGALVRLPLAWGKTAVGRAKRALLGMTENGEAESPTTSTQDPPPGEKDAIEINPAENPGRGERPRGGRVQQEDGLPETATTAAELHRDRATVGVLPVSVDDLATFLSRKLKALIDLGLGEEGNWGHIAKVAADRGIVNFFVSGKMRDDLQGSLKALAESLFSGLVLRVYDPKEFYLLPEGGKKSQSSAGSCRTLLSMLSTLFSTGQVDENLDDVVRGQGDSHSDSGDFYYGRGASTTSATRTSFEARDWAERLELAAQEAAACELSAVPRNILQSVLGKTQTDWVLGRQLDVTLNAGHPSRFTEKPIARIKAHLPNLLTSLWGAGHNKDEEPGASDENNGDSMTGNTKSWQKFLHPRGLLSQIKWLLWEIIDFFKNPTLKLLGDVVKGSLVPQNYVHLLEDFDFLKHTVVHLSGGDAVSNLVRPEEDCDWWRDRRGLNDPNATPEPPKHCRWLLVESMHRQCPDEVVTNTAAAAAQARRREGIVEGVKARVRGIGHVLKKQWKDFKSWRTGAGATTPALRQIDMLKPMRAVPRPRREARYYLLLDLGATCQVVVLDQYVTRSDAVAALEHREYVRAGPKALLTFEEAVPDPWGHYSSMTTGSPLGIDSEVWNQQENLPQRLAEAARAGKKYVEFYIWQNKPQRKMSRIGVPIDDVKSVLWDYNAKFIQQSLGTVAPHKLAREQTSGAFVAQVVQDTQDPGGCVLQSAVSSKTKSSTPAQELLFQNPYVVCPKSLKDSKQHLTTQLNLEHLNFARSVDDYDARLPRGVDFSKKQEQFAFSTMRQTKCLPDWVTERLVRTSTADKKTSPTTSFDADGGFLFGLMVDHAQCDKCAAVWFAKVRSGSVPVGAVEEFAHPVVLAKYDIAPEAANQCDMRNVEAKVRGCLLLRQQGKLECKACRLSYELFPRSEHLSSPSLVDFFQDERPDKDDLLNGAAQQDHEYLTQLKQWTDEIVKNVLSTDMGEEAGAKRKRAKAALRDEYCPRREVDFGKCKRLRLGHCAATIKRCQQEASVEAGKVTASLVGMDLDTHLEHEKVLESLNQKCKKEMEESTGCSELLAEVACAKVSYSYCNHALVYTKFFSQGKSALQTLFLMLRKFVLHLYDYDTFAVHRRTLRAKGRPC
ncbi:unnamed protein product [Amoebophrya sp. A120]|nr:unnamed protein product [Amoebophrya sp. A120]|eukprot:GSA120T00019760001.1